MGTFVLPSFNRSSLKQKSYRGKWNKPTICLFELNLHQRKGRIMMNDTKYPFLSLNWKYQVMLCSFRLQSNPSTQKYKGIFLCPLWCSRPSWRLLSVLLYTSGVSESSRELKAVVFSLSLLKGKKKKSRAEAVWNI